MYLSAYAGNGGIRITSMKLHENIDGLIKRLKNDENIKIHIKLGFFVVYEFYIEDPYVPRKLKKSELLSYLTN